jgi:hypothetical protein
MNDIYSARQLGCFWNHFGGVISSSKIGRLKKQNNLTRTISLPVQAGNQTSMPKNDRI